MRSGQGQINRSSHIEARRGKAKASNYAYTAALTGRVLTVRNVQPAIVWIILAEPNCFKGVMVRGA
eukprot:scaffold17310_cov72-Skeletonema_dohrnii-CCMP3373.AAC.2